MLIQNGMSAAPKDRKKHRLSTVQTARCCLRIPKPSRWVWTCAALRRNTTTNDKQQQVASSKQAAATTTTTTTTTTAATTTTTTTTTSSTTRRRRRALLLSLMGHERILNRAVWHNMPPGYRRFRSKCSIPADFEPNPETQGKTSATRFKGKKRQAGISWDENQEGPPSAMALCCTTGMIWYGTIWYGMVKRYVWSWSGVVWGLSSCTIIQFHSVRFDLTWQYVICDMVVLRVFAIWPSFTFDLTLPGMGSGHAALNSKCFFILL